MKSAAMLVSGLLLPLSLLRWVSAKLRSRGPSRIREVLSMIFDLMLDTTAGRRGPVGERGSGIDGLWLAQPTFHATCTVVVNEPEWRSGRWCLRERSSRSLP